MGGSTADEDAIRVHEVLNSTTFREELRVVENLELGIGTVKLELFMRGLRQHEPGDLG
jgi:hypothetical protein